MMRNPGSLFDVHGLASQFERLIATARGNPAAVLEPAQQTQRTALREVVAKGANPGALLAFAYVPEQVSASPALVVALHGCGQTASDYNHGTGWSSLADQHGFVVLFPEQQSSNNPKACFSWFVPGDVTRGQGEARSIHDMVEHAIEAYGVDRRRVFITGLSAGGAMTSVMLATYPQTFAGGAIIAGLAYGSASSVQEAFQAMFTDRQFAAKELGDRVRNASEHRGSWPSVSVWHGTADAIVKPSNADHIVAQWADVLGFSPHPTAEQRIGRHTRRAWNDADGNTRIEAFSLEGMAHGVPISAATGAKSASHAGPFFLDVGLSSTHHIAHFWRLGETAARQAGTQEANIAPDADGASTRQAADWYVPNFTMPAKPGAADPALGAQPHHVENSASGVIGNIASTIDAALKTAGLRRR
jgi:poly(hydroxyalkanoate) depolymerase family esterase